MIIWGEKMGEVARDGKVIAVDRQAWCGNHGLSTNPTKEDKPKWDKYLMLDRNVTEADGSTTRTKICVSCFQTTKVYNI